MRKYFDAHLHILLTNLKEENLNIVKIIADAPERAALRNQKQHGGYFSCDICLANPENFRMEGSRASKVLLCFSKGININSPFLC